MDHTLDARKKAARKTAFAARQHAFESSADTAAQAANTHLSAVLAPYRGAVLAGYMPMRSELDPLLAMGRHDGPVCVPVIIAQGRALRFRQWSPHAEMVRGTFGALIPRDGIWREPEVMIVPLVAFDRSGGRLGYGGGFYDRTIEGLRAKGTLTTIGFAFDAQELDDLPLETTDQKLDMIVTETGVRRF